jgi:hypothetical protein
MKYALAAALLSFSALVGLSNFSSPVAAQARGGGNNGIGNGGNNNNGNGNGNNGNGRGNGGGQTYGAPAPLLAGGIPGIIALGGAYWVVALRRRKG